MEVTYLKVVRQSDGGRAFSTHHHLECEDGWLGDWEGEIRNHVTHPGAYLRLCVWLMSLRHRVMSF